jgi:hypothetical protein
LLPWWQSRHATLSCFPSNGNAVPEWLNPEEIAIGFQLDALWHELHKAENDPW